MASVKINNFMKTINENMNRFRQKIQEAEELLINLEALEEIKLQLQTNVKIWKENYDDMEKWVAASKNQYEEIQNLLHWFVGDSNAIASGYPTALSSTFRKDSELPMASSSISKGESTSKASTVAVTKSNDCNATATNPESPGDILTDYLNKITVEGVGPKTPEEISSEIRHGMRCAVAVNKSSMDIAISSNEGTFHLKGIQNEVSGEFCAKALKASDYKSENYKVFEMIPASDGNLLFAVTHEGLIIVDILNENPDAFANWGKYSGVSLTDSKRMKLGKLEITRNEINTSKLLIVKREINCQLPAGGTFPSLIFHLGKRNLLMAAGLGGISCIVVQMENMRLKALPNVKFFGADERGLPFWLTEDNMLLTSESCKKHANAAPSLSPATPERADAKQKTRYTIVVNAPNRICVEIKDKNLIHDSIVASDFATENQVYFTWWRRGTDFPHINFLFDAAAVTREKNVTRFAIIESETCYDYRVGIFSMSDDGTGFDNMKALKNSTKTVPKFPNKKLVFLGIAVGSDSEVKLQILAISKPEIGECKLTIYVE